MADNANGSPAAPIKTTGIDGTPTYGAQNSPQAALAKVRNPGMPMTTALSALNPAAPGDQMGPSPYYTPPPQEGGSFPSTAPGGEESGDWSSGPYPTYTDYTVNRNPPMSPVEQVTPTPTPAPYLGTPINMLPPAPPPPPAPYAGRSYANFLQDSINQGLHGIRQLPTGWTEAERAAAQQAYNQSRPKLGPGVHPAGAPTDVQQLKMQMFNEGQARGVARRAEMAAAGGRSAWRDLREVDRGALERTRRAENEATRQAAWLAAQAQPQPVAAALPPAPAVPLPPLPVESILPGRNMSDVIRPQAGRMRRF